jgi:Fe-Mn family superoxide dismutase
MFSLPELPYAYDALVPTISAETLHLHHDKHHATYVKTLNELLEGKGGASDSLEAVIRDAAKGEAKLFNNAAQAWNHAFFWVAMTPNSGQPEGDLKAAIDAQFGDIAALGDALVKEGAGHFGSGWVWLLSDAGGRLSIQSTHDAHNSLADPAVTPLLVCDLWEHSYYLDYKNDRKAYLEAWFKQLPNWALAASQFAAARGSGEAWRYPAPAFQDAQSSSKAA